MTTEDKTQEELLKADLQNALDRDFRALYVKGFTTDWQTKRMVRRLELEVMSLENLTEYILADRKAQAKRLLDAIVVSHYIQTLYPEPFVVVYYCVNCRQNVNPWSHV